MIFSSNNFRIGFLALTVLLGTVAFFAGASGVVESRQKPFTVGEKLSYQISFGTFEDSGFAELFVVSEGKIGEKNAVEIRGRIKSSDFVSSAFYLFDRSRTVFASISSGLPLYYRSVANESGLPKETIQNYLEKPATEFDLLTMLYKARANGGAGTFSVSENGKSYSFDFAATGGEKVVTAFEEFDTTVSTVTSNYFSEIGVSEVKVNFTADEERVPVRFRLKTERGSFDVRLASRVIIRETPEASKTPTPTPRRTPVRTPTATPPVYKKNQPLPSEFPFSIGESLDYQIKQGNRVVNKVRLLAERRDLVNGKDTLVLRASVIESTGNSVFAASDSAVAEVSPETLVPYKFSLLTKGPLGVWSHNAVFDQNAGKVAFGGQRSISAPIGTHSLLSLTYAIRSFNIRLSRNKKNPVNDTRVSMFLRDKAIVLTLRPSEMTKVKIGDEELNAEMITIVTGDRNIDRYRPRVWLGTGPRRLPLAFQLGTYRAELVNR